MTDCIFCEIVAGRAEASIVYEDDLSMAFLDLRQVNAGHTLVVPKRHIREVFDLDDSVGAALMGGVVRVSRAVRAAFDPDGINVFQSNGEAAGQEVFHLHFHVLPRRRGDSLLRVYGQPPAPAERSALDAQAVAVRAAMA